MWAKFEIVKAKMLVCISCLKVFDLIPRLEVGCNLDPLRRGMMGHGVKNMT